MEKIVTTIKDHTCGFCDKTITKGSKAFYMEGKSPVYETDICDAAMGLEGKQVGIKYWRVWYCYENNKQCPSCYDEY